MAERHESTRRGSGVSAPIRITALAAACSLAFALAGCRTVPLGEPIAIQIPANLSEQQAQDLITEFIHGSDKKARARPSGRITRKLHGSWQIEQWEPRFMVLAYAWRSHLLRLNLEFANRTVLFRIGESANLRQSPERIHKSARALTMDLVTALRRDFAEASLGQWKQDGLTSRRTGSKKSEFCSSMWEGDPQEQASCQRAQRRSYDQLLPLISEVKAGVSSAQSTRLRQCYAVSQTWAGADWEAIERCLYSPPASAR